MAKYPALLGRVSGVAEIGRTSLHFTPDDPGHATYELRYSSIDVSLEGENSHHFVLSDRGNQGPVVILQDPKAIELLASYGIQSAKEALARSKTKTRLRIAAWSTPFLTTAALIVLFPLLLSLIPVSWMTGVLSPQSEKKIGHFFLSLGLSKIDPPARADQLQAVKTLAEWLKSKNPDLAKIDFEIHIADDPTPNAFATMGDIIVFNSGFLVNAKSTEEVLGVMAHEMAHVERKHTLKSLSSNVGFMAGMIVISAVVGPDTAAWAARGLNLVTLKYSRDDETEADTRGFKFLEDAGVSARGMIDFFERRREGEIVIEKMGEHVAQVSSLISTHPMSSERIAVLQTLEESRTNPANAVLPVSLKDLQN